MGERWDAVPVSGVEEPAAYYYSTYNGEDKAPVSNGRKSYGTWRRSKPYWSGY